MCHTVKSPIIAPVSTFSYSFWYGPQSLLSCTFQEGGLISGKIQMKQHDALNAAKSFTETAGGVSVMVSALTKPGWFRRDITTANSSLTESEAQWRARPLRGSAGHPRPRTPARSRCAAWSESSWTCWWGRGCVPWSQAPGSSAHTSVCVRERSGRGTLSIKHLKAGCLLAHYS